MKRSIERTFFFATLSLSLAAVEQAQGMTCTPAMLVGTWGYTQTGTVIGPNGAVPVAAINRVYMDADLNTLGTQTVSSNGVISKRITKGTTTLNPDCTATHSASIYDQSGNLLSTVVVAWVVVNNGNEILGMVTSLVQQPSGTSTPAVLTINYKKIFPGTQQ